MINWYYEEVYSFYYDTVGHFHWTGVYSGHHVIKERDGE